MGDLTFIEKHKLEKLLGMGSGYVLDFFNHSFSDFVVDSTGRNIYDARYDRGTGSKANRLRAFWEKEPNHLVGKLIADLLEYAKVIGTPDEARFLEASRASPTARAAAIAVFRQFSITRSNLKVSSAVSGLRSPAALSALKQADE